MRDRNDKEVHYGELITIVDRPDVTLREHWAVFDFIEEKGNTRFILRNCITNEFEIVNKSNIERTY